MSARIGTVLPARCGHSRCDRVIAPGAEWCCGACQLAQAAGYAVPDEGNLSHTAMCQRRQLAGVSS